MTSDSENTERRIAQETPEGAACAISHALRYLAREADKLGITGVSELIKEASDEALEFARRRERLNEERDQP